VRADFEVVEIVHLGLATVVETYDFLHEGLVVAIETIAVPLQVQNGATLRFHFVDVQVVNAGNFVTGLGALNVLALLEVALFGGFLSGAQFVLNTEVVMAALVLPELL
jgi:hypothetical protein